MNEKIYYFVVDASTTLEDIIKATGISHSNFWFEFFINLFSQSCTTINDYESFIKIIGRDKQHTIKYLSENYEIDGLTFIGKKVIVFKNNNQHVSFKLIKSRKIKVICQEEFYESQKA